MGEIEFFQNPDPYRAGDVTRDGFIDSTDADDLQAAIDSSTFELRFDLNGDSLVDAADMDVLNVIRGISPAPVAPAPVFAIGEDPATDGGENETFGGVLGSGGNGGVETSAHHAVASGDITSEGMLGVNRATQITSGNRGKSGTHLESLAPSFNDSWLEDQGDDGVLADVFDMLELI